MAALADSDSSEDENLTLRLQEAVVASYTHKLCEEDTFSKAQISNSYNAFDTSKPSAAVNTPVKKSLRETEEGDSEQDLWYSVTPEVRSFIARKLTEMLERETKVIIRKTVRQAEEPPPLQETGIRLFTMSSHVCIHPSDPVLPAPQQPGRKCRQVSSSSSSDSSENERLASVAVTEEDLLHEREMYRHLQKLDSVDLMDQTSSSYCSGSAHQVVQVSLSTSIVSSVQHNSHSCDKSKQAKEQIPKRKGKGHNLHLSSETGNNDKLEVKLCNDSGKEYRMSSDARQKQSDPQESDTLKKIATQSSLLVHREHKKKRKKHKKIKLDSLMGNEPDLSVQKSSREWWTSDTWSAESKNYLVNKKHNIQQ